MICSCSVAKSRPTLCNSMNCSTPGFPVLYHLPEFAQIHVHWVSGAIQFMVWSILIDISFLFEMNRVSEIASHWWDDDNCHTRTLASTFPAVYILGHTHDSLIGALGSHLGVAQWYRIHLSVQEIQETRVWSMGREDSLEEEMATQSSILAWRTPWSGEFGGLQYMRSQSVGHECTWVHVHTILYCLSETYRNWYGLKCNYRKNYNKKSCCCTAQLAWVSSVPGTWETKLLSEEAW